MSKPLCACHSTRVTEYIPRDGHTQFPGFSQAARGPGAQRTRCKMLEWPENGVEDGQPDGHTPSSTFSVPGPFLSSWLSHLRGDRRLIQQQVSKDTKAASGFGASFWGSLPQRHVIQSEPRHFLAVCTPQIIALFTGHVLPHLFSCTLLAGRELGKGHLAKGSLPGLGGRQRCGQENSYSEHIQSPNQQCVLAACFSVT